MAPITTILIDDEDNARHLLARLLNDLSFPIRLIGEAADVEDGIRLIEKEKPDLVFLDVQLKSGTGFDLLNQIPSLPGEVIFVTAYHEYAIRAFDFAALGYLLKPLRISDLKETLQRFVDRRKIGGGDQRLRTFLTNQSGEESRLVVPDVNGFRVITLPQVVYLRAEVNYTRFYLTDGTELLSSKTLKEYERILLHSGFCRIHQSFLINITHVTSYQRGEGGVVKLSNGDHLDVSRRKKADFMRYFLG